MNLDALVASVRTKTGRTDKDDVAEEGIRFGLQKLSQLFPFDQFSKEMTATLASGASSTQLPPSLDEVLELRLINPTSPSSSYKLDLRRKTWFTEKFPDVANDDTTGRPLFCYRDPVSNILYFDRKSDDTYTIKFTGFFSCKFVSDSDETALSGSDETLISYGTKHVYASVQMYQDAQYWEGQFIQGLQALITQKSRDTGVHYVAEEWSRTRDLNPTPPWLDPFQGV